MDTAGPNPPADAPREAAANRPIATASGTRPTLPGRAALKPADLADARRRRPDSDLTPYAQARGLTAVGSQTIAGYFSAMPLDADRQFNVLHGRLDADREGVLFHHLYAYPVDHQGEARNATFYGFVWNPRLPKGWWKPDWRWLPLVSDLATDRPRDDIEYAVGVPCTTLATPVPAAAGLGSAAIQRRAEGGPLAGTRSDLLRALGGRPFCRVTLRDGILAITVDGFVADASELDRLRSAVAAAAASLEARAHELLAACQPPRPAEVKALLSFDLGRWRGRGRGRARAVSP